MYKPGEFNKNTDALSRITINHINDYRTFQSRNDADPDNELQITIPDETNEFRIIS